MLMQGDSIEYYLVRKEWERGLCSLFSVLTSNGEYKNFHPHPLTKKEVSKKVSYHGKDLYFVQVLNNRVVGYGILRGWDEGYEIPSLGIAIHPDVRRQGLSNKFMIFLHNEAKKKGAKKVRLKVYAKNKNAINLYTKLGYEFSMQGNQLLGYVSI